MIKLTTTKDDIYNIILKKVAREYLHYDLIESTSKYKDIKIYDIDCEILFYPDWLEVKYWDDYVLDFWSYTMFYDNMIWILAWIRNYNKRD